MNVVPIRNATPESPLAIPGELTETGLTLPEHLSFEEWERVGMLLQRVEKSVRWWIGDWLAFGERKYGETYAQAVEVTGYVAADLQNMVYVSTAIPPSQRCENLSWSHHRELASLEPAERERWTEKAAREQWSTRELREQLRLVKHDPSENPIPANAPECRRCGHPCRFCEVDIATAKKAKRGKNR